MRARGETCAGPRCSPERGTRRVRRVGHLGRRGAWRPSVGDLGVLERTHPLPARAVPGSVWRPRPLFARPGCGRPLTVRRSRRRAVARGVAPRRRRSWPRCRVGSRTRPRRRVGSRRRGVAPRSRRGRCTRRPPSPYRAHRNSSRIPRRKALPPLPHTNQNRVAGRIQVAGMDGVPSSGTTGAPPTVLLATSTAATTT
jgi:hypothetical protein